VSFSKIFEILVVFVSQLGRVNISLAVIFGVHIEALSVSGISNGWDNRAGLTATEEIVPVDSVEKGVGFDAAGPAADITEASGAVYCTE
jgi:hypothetical protein